MPALPCESSSGGSSGLASLNHGHRRTHTSHSSSAQASHREKFVTLFLPLAQGHFMIKQKAGGWEFPTVG